MGQTHKKQRTRIQALSLCLFLFMAYPAYAQDVTDADGENVETLVAQDFGASSETDILTITFENDLFGKGTDQHYTNGVRFSYLDVGTDFPQAVHEIANMIPDFDLNDTSSLVYSIGQNLYTPSDITQSAQDPNDRPWAGYLYGSLALFSATENHVDEVEVSLGVVGPAALGEPTQKFVHKHISGSDEPKGWDNQLKNEPAAMVSWERRWPHFYDRDLSPFYASITPHTGLSVGNVYTNASVGLTFQLGPGYAMLEDTPIRIRPAMPGTGYFQNGNGFDSWSIFAGIEGRAVGRNIFLDGNTFRDSHSVDKKYFVADINGGVSYTIGSTRLSYTLVYRTEEFEGQGDPDLFGALTLGHRF